MSDQAMQAIRVYQYGNEEVLQLESIPVPVPKDNEVLIRVHYAGIVPVDYKIRNGWMHARFPQTFPYIPGTIMSGVIDTVGSAVSEFKASDRVFGSVKGAYAAYAIAEPKELVHMPDRLSLKEAATIRGGADTAWKALFSEGELGAGQTVLIHAAAGGVGHFAVQLAKWRGATVIGTASTGNIDYIQSLGADQVIDYTTTAFESVVHDVDLVVDAVGGTTEDRSWSVIKQGGKLVALTQLPSKEKAKAFKVTATFNTKFPTHANLEQLAQLLADGTIKAEINTVYSLADVKQAHKQCEGKRGRGRILLELFTIK